MCAMCIEWGELRNHEDLPSPHGFVYWTIPDRTTAVPSGRFELTFVCTLGMARRV
jgi:hypothetical protein